MNPAAGTLVARRFHLVRELGRGSMGTVWLADHKTLGLRCALKFATAEGERDPTYRQRFEREARAVAQLDSPNVVRVIDYDVFEGVPFLAMEWLSGEDLETRLQRVGRLEARDVYRIVTQVAQGLERAHAAGIIHRDLKPGNVFLARSADGEVAKILDFGLAKMALCEGAEAMTQAGCVLGTPVYMSPEQARGLADIDARADVWSLAVIAYECLLGKLPFNGRSLGAVFAGIMFEPIPVPSAVDPDIPPAFDRWWERAACRDVAGRFATAREMAEALGQALGVDDRHSSKPDLATAHTVSPPSQRRNTRWPAALLMVALFAAAALFLPNVRQVVPSEVSSSVRSALHATALSASYLVEEARAALPYISPASTAPASAASAASAGGSTPPTVPGIPTPVRLAPADPAPVSMPFASNTLPTLLAVPSAVTPAVTPVAAPSLGRVTTEDRATLPGPSLKSAATQASGDREPVASDLPLDESLENAFACRAGQRRCDGRVLEMCNEARDGWAEVTECEPDAVCDATGSGGCVSRGN
jgi:serine/threonine protein kinase